MFVPGMCVSHSVMSNSLWPIECSPPGFSVHGIIQARILEWDAIPFSREFLVYNILIQYFYTLQNDHQGKSSYHLSPYKDNIFLLTIFPTLYISSLWFIYFVSGSLYLLISLTYFSRPPIPILTGNYLSILYIS